MTDPDFSLTDLSDEEWTDQFDDVVNDLRRLADYPPGATDQQRQNLAEALLLVADPNQWRHTIAAAVTDGNGESDGSPDGSLYWQSIEMAVPDLIFVLRTYVDSHRPLTGGDRLDLAPVVRAMGTVAQWSSVLSAVDENPEYFARRPGG